MADTEYPADLLELERSAWTAIQEGTLTRELAHAVQQGVTAFAAETGVDRHKAEMGLKKIVRHTEAV
ncbi:hypothetical protein ABZX40_13405 [Streptomyces sp. NPDC004610]|uniref:hypothetical protein n=1 Tax=unclassified Streptomyces TaxID=2593676 RepID=UPI0033AF3DA8